MNVHPQGVDKFAPLRPQERAAIQSARGKTEAEGQLISPIPSDAPDMPQTHRMLGKPSQVWTYSDASGETLFYVCRFDLHGERKQFLPLSLWRENGRLTWRWKAVPEPRPLYGLDRLAKRPDAPVAICEGEKSADAAARIFPNSVCITSPGGSQAASKADWSPLRGRRVPVWPDADKPGAKYAATVAGNLHGQATEILIIDAMALASMAPDGGKHEPKEGWDVADAIAEWENLGALCKAAYGLAEPFEPGAPGAFDASREAQPFWTMSLLRASGIKPEPISWLWRDWLARGKMHIIAGQPGTGKTTLAMKMAATVSARSHWPDGTRGTKGNVIIWSGEDDPADTLVPRLEASGADLSCIFFVEMCCGKERRDFDPAKDITALQTAIGTAGGASLIIIDPIVSATTADSHKNGETRRRLQPLVYMATKLGAAILGITHFTKGSEGRAPIDRVTGSVAFGALARVVMVAAREQDGDEGKPGPRVLMRAKSNIGPDDGGVNYEVQLVPMREQPDIVASVVSWGSSVSGTAREILAGAEAGTDKEESGALQEATDFLLDLLIDGPKPAKECKAAAAEAALSWATVRRAQDKLGIKPSKDSMTGGWTWSLSEGAHQNTKMLTPERLSTFGNHEHLRDESVAVTNNLGDTVTDGWKDEI
jgi:putative DNA primase/helicase